MFHTTLSDHEYALYVLWILHRIISTKLDQITHNMPSIAGTCSIWDIKHNNEVTRNRRFDQASPNNLLNHTTNLRKLNTYNGPLSLWTKIFWILFGYDIFLSMIYENWT